ncbi:MAG: RtcB family protein [Caldilineaceae bacterium]
MRLARAGPPSLHRLRARVPGRDPSVQDRAPRPELVCAPLDSPEGEAYFAAMRRRPISPSPTARPGRTGSGSVRNGARFQRLDPTLRQVYDVAHNIGKVETHTVNGRTMQVCVHRKGATCAFGPGNPDVPPDYRAGQPVLVPGSMGTASYVLAGTAGAMATTFGSTCHGAGREMSRTAARKQVQGEALKQQLNRRGIRAGQAACAVSPRRRPWPTKPWKTSSRRWRGRALPAVARLEPLAVIKG